MLCLCLSLRSFADNGDDRHEVAFSYGGIAPAAFAYSNYFNLDFGHASIGHYLGETDFVHRMKWQQPGWRRTSTPWQVVNWQQYILAGIFLTGRWKPSPLNMSSPVWGSCPGCLPEI